MACWFRAAVELNPNDADAHYNFGRFLAHNGNLKEGVEHLQQAVHLQPDSADNQYDLAEALRQSGESQQAIEHFQAALRIKPDLVPAYANLARTLATAERSEEAVAAAEKGIEVGRRANQGALADQIDERLSHYRIELRRGP